MLFDSRSLFSVSSRRGSQSEQLKVRLEKAEVNDEVSNEVIYEVSAAGLDRTLVDHP